MTYPAIALRESARAFALAARRLGPTQEEAAAALGISRRSVMRYANGERPAPSTAIVRATTKLRGLPPFPARRRLERALFTAGVVAIDLAYQRRRGSSPVATDYARRLEDELAQLPARWRGF